MSLHQSSQADREIQAEHSSSLILNGSLSSLKINNLNSHRTVYSLSRPRQLKWYCSNWLSESTRPQKLWKFADVLSEGFWARPAMSKVVKIKFLDFSYWASSTPWRHVLSLKTFCRNPVLSWAIRYSVFQKVKSTSSLEFVCDYPFSTFWHLMVKFG